MMPPPAIKFKCQSFSQEWLPLVKLQKKLSVRYGEEENGYFKGVSYYSVTRDVQQVIFDSVPKVCRHMFDEVFIMVINREHVPPHIDSNALATINFYVKTAGQSVTTFYAETAPSEKIKIPNQTDGYMLDPSNLVETFSFCAKEDEAWLLNIKSPHSVQCEKGLRVAFTLQSFRHSYEEIVKTLEHSLVI